ncbi:MAG: DUF5640 domain-containing protein [Bacteroidales bacterium]|nr:DUF5640 domain-containing protein [Bacteroidales bacterium]
MNKKSIIIISLLLLVSLLVFCGCEPDKISLTVSETALVGTWHSSDAPKEYWRFDANHTGETWDESEDVQEGEGTKFNWSTQDDQLRLDLYGEMGQHVYYDYTIEAQTQTSFTWKDLYGNSRTFTKR